MPEPGPNLDALFMNLSSGSEQEAESALPGIAQAGSAALPGLKDLLASDDPDIRWWALRALAEVNDDAVQPILLAALGDPVVTVQQCAALALRKYPNPGAIPALQSALTQGDRMLARLAADALIAIGDETTPVLLETLENGAQQARIEAIRALASLTDPRAVPALFKALDDGAPLIEYWADQGLQSRGIGMTFFEP